MPIEWFHERHGWAERNHAYLEGARKMFRDSVAGALESASWAGQDVDCVVTVTSSGIAKPTLEAQLFSEMGFRRDVMRVPIFGLGCAGGVSGLSVAQSLADAAAGRKVLLVVVEACSVSFRADRMQKADIIAAALFGDGSAAACLGTDAPLCDGRIELGSGHQSLWPDTLDIMGWDVDETGLGVIFDRSIAEFVTSEFAQATAGALKAANLDPGQIDRFVCHPGGAKVVEAVERSLHLAQGSLDAERETLRNYGNMSAPSVLFVMQAVLDGGARGQMMACALGPGFTASYLPFHVGLAA
ncbi:3-oxoacyl-[acyl-carrier-protein] synthase III C-terminal domain-containing protein [Sulfitobacter sp. LCG007]